MDFIGFTFGIGFVQGLILALVLIFIPSDHRRANAIMAALVLVVASSLLHNWMIRSNTWLEFSNLALVILPFYLAFGPLLFLYAYTLTGGQLSYRHWLHFLPLVVLFFTMNLSFWQLSSDQQQMIVSARWGGRDDLARSTLVQEALPSSVKVWLELHLFSLIYIPHFGIYCVMVLANISRHRRNLEQHFSSLEQMNLQWLRGITIACLIYLFAYMFFNRAPSVIMGQADYASVAANIHAISLVLLVYGIAAVALFQPSLINGVEQARHSSPGLGDDLLVEIDRADKSHSGDAPETGSTEGEARTGGKYARSRLSMEDAQRYKMKIMQVMQDEELYLDPGLTLPELAKACELSAPQISQLINLEIGQNFFTFVNNYRVQLARRILADPQTASMPIVELALEVGFKSKSSFYDAFKRVTGMTPTQFKQAVKESEDKAISG